MAGLAAFTASTNRRVSVATPDRWQRKLRAVRSAVRIERSGPLTAATTEPGDDRDAVGAGASRRRGPGRPGEGLRGAAAGRRPRPAAGPRSATVPSRVGADQRGGQVAERAAGPRPAPGRRPRAPPARRVDDARTVHRGWSVTCRSAPSSRLTRARTGNSRSGQNGDHVAECTSRRRHAGSVSGYSTPGVRAPGLGRGAPAAAQQGRRPPSPGWPARPALAPAQAAAGRAGRSHLGDDVGRRRPVTPASAARRRPRHGPLQAVPSFSASTGRVGVGAHRSLAPATASRAPSVGAVPRSASRRAIEQWPIRPVEP